MAKTTEFRPRILEQLLAAFGAQRGDDRPQFQQPVQPVALESGGSQCRGDGFIECRPGRV